MTKSIFQEIRGISRWRSIRRTEQATALDRILETNAVFVHIPKCGGKSVVFDLYGLSEHDWFGHAGISFYKSLLGPSRFRKAFKFAFIRDPIARCLSGFKFRKRGGFGLDNDKTMASELVGLSFEEFVLSGRLSEMVAKDVVFMQQAPFLYLWDGTLGVDRVCFFENFDKELRSLPLKLKKTTPSHMNASPREPEWELSMATRHMISNIYAQDYQLISRINHYKTNAISHN